MDFKINFFNMVGKPPLLTNTSPFLGIRKIHECTTNKVSGFAGGFFSRVFSSLFKTMEFTSFNFRISKNLMDQFQRSTDFYKRFPQLRPSFNNSGPIYNMKLFKSIYPV